MDFWRVWPLGRLYHRRAFWEDGLNPISRRAGGVIEVGQELDPAYQILYVAEALEAGIYLANRMECGAAPAVDQSVYSPGLLLGRIDRAGQ